MSHITRQEMEIHNLLDFEIACRQLNGTLEQNVDSYYTQEFGNQKAEHRVVFDGLEDQIGLIRQGDSYRMHFAPYGDVGTVIGFNGKKLEREYSIALQNRMYQKKGFRVQRRDVDGKTHLEYTKNV